MRRRLERRQQTAVFHAGDMIFFAPQNDGGRRNPGHAARQRFLLRRQPTRQPAQRAEKGAALVVIPHPFIDALKQEVALWLRQRVEVGVEGTQ